MVSLLSDINECHSDPCKNDGTCKDLVNKFVCICKDGFVGAMCESGMFLPDEELLSPHPGFFAGMLQFQTV